MPNMQTAHHIIAPHRAPSTPGSETPIRWVIFQRDGLARLAGDHASEYDAVRYALRLEGAAA